ncbi:MAG: DNA alkylation repair protein [Bacteroidia bacterium]
MDTVKKIIDELKSLSSAKAKSKQEYFGITGVNSFGMTTPQMRVVAKKIGKNHELAMQLWKTGNHEAKHIAIFIADPKQVTEKLMETLLKDFNSWDTVDNCCGTLFTKTPYAFEKAIEWTRLKTEFQKRAGFVLMAELAIHNKTAKDAAYEKFFPHIIRESHDERNFVKKAVNWALRQIGKRNKRLCKKAIKAAKEIYAKGDATSRWIATDALRELEKYQKEGKIKNIGSA